MICQTLSILVRLNFARVRIGNSGDHIGVGQSALEHIRIEPVLGQCILVENIIRQIRPVLDGLNIVNTLETQVVNRDHGLCISDGGVLEKCAQEYRHKSCLPVMAMDNIRDPVHVIKRSECRLAEIAVLRDIIDQICIRLIPSEEFLVVDEIIDHAVPDILHNTDIVLLSVTGQIHVETSPVDHLLLIFLRNALVPRKDHLHITVPVDQRLGKGVHDISESAGLYERITFRSDKCDAPARCLGFLCLDRLLDSSQNFIS